MVGGCTFFQDIIDHPCIEQFGDTNLLSPNVNTFNSVLEADLECVSGELAPMRSLRSSSFGALEEVMEAHPKSKRVKLSVVEDRGGNSDGQQKVSHIAVERNRRKQMNDHLNVLRALMPCFYVKRADQASIIGGVVDYITELQQVLQSLEAKKQRKVYSELVLSPRLVSSPGTLAISPPKPGLSPRPSLPISPNTPQSIISPYRPMLGPFVSPSLDPSPAISFTNSDSGNELVASLRSAVAEVEVKFVGGNLLLRTACSNRIPGQATKVITVLENLSLEVLHVNISVVDEAMVNSFTIKVGVGCQLSAQELAQHIQQTFC